jgi:hypothetical protein
VGEGKVQDSGLSFKGNAGEWMGSDVGTDVGEF